MKELLRRIMFPFIPEEMTAKTGTLKFALLRWLYGEPDSYEDLSQDN